MLLGPYIYCSLFPCSLWLATGKHLWVFTWRHSCLACTRAKLRSARDLALRTTDVWWTTVDINTQVRVSLRWDSHEECLIKRAQLPTVVTCSWTHLVEGKERSSSFPVSLPHTPLSTPWNRLPNKLLVLKSLLSLHLKQQKRLPERLADENEDSNRRPWDF